MNTKIKFYLISSFLMGLANSIFDATFNFYLLERGISESEAGSIYAIATLCMALTVVPLLIANRYIDKKKILLIASFVYALPFLTFPLVSSVIFAAIALSLVLSGMLCLLSVGNALAGESVTAQDRPKIFSYFFISYLGSGILGTFSVALSTQIWGGTLEIYRILLTLAGISALLMIFFRYLSAPKNTSHQLTEIEKPSLSGTEKINLTWIFLAAILIGFSMALVFRFSNIIFAQALKIDVSSISYILSADKLVSIVGTILVPILVKKFSYRFSAILLGILTFGCLFVQTLSIPTGLFVVLYLVRLLLNYGQMPVLDSLTIDGFQKKNNLVSSGIRQSSFYMGGAAAAAIYGMLLNQNNWQLCLILAAITGLLGAFAMSFIHTNPIPSEETR